MRPCDHLSFDMTGQCTTCGAIDWEARCAQLEADLRHARHAPSKLLPVGDAFVDPAEVVAITKCSGHNPGCCDIHRRGCDRAMFVTGVTVAEAAKALGLT